MTTPRCGAPEADRPTVAEALRRFLPAFAARFPASPHTHQVLRRLSHCHTGSAGWSLWQCARCQSAHWRPMGCGDRHCPQCQDGRREDWLGKQRAALLPVRYYHWVFTLPAVLRPLALQNPKALYNLLFDAASETLLQFGAERLGARIGITALLHTWGQNLIEHPHLHCLVTGGGLVGQPGEPPRWRGPKQALYLFPVRAVATMFRGKFMAGLEALRAGGALVFHGRLEPWSDPGVWERTLGPLRAGKWNVFAKGSVVGPEAVLDYLGRYTHRVAIANGRLVRIGSDGVTFRYKDYRQNGASKEMTLPGDEFVRRLSLHVLPRGFTKIRHYGILGNNRRKALVPLARTALEHSRWHLATAPVPSMPRPKPESAGCPRCGGDDIVCIGRLDARGRFTGLRRGALAMRLGVGEPSRFNDSS